MASAAQTTRPHAVCIPYPAQGHINPMFKLAKLLHFHGFHVTFVNTHYNHSRRLRCHGPRSLDGVPSFRFAAIPDGLPPTDADATQDTAALCASVAKHCAGPFTELLRRLNREGPPVSCVVSDMGMTFTLESAAEVGMKVVMLWTASACGLLGYAQFPRLVREGYTPFEDTSCLTNGYLETTIDGIPAMKGIRLKDLPTFFQTTDPDDFLLNYVLTMLERTRKGATAIVLNTFDALEHDVLASLAPEFPPSYVVGPFHFLLEHLHDESIESIGSNLWKEDTDCLDWLDSQDPESVVYVNFGSITVMSNDQLVEFAWGLANSGKTFLWIIRPDLVSGETAILPEEFVELTKGRSLMASWCDQERVLKHPAIKGFLTHSGWNSTLDAVCNGVPVVSWPFFAEQQTNCWFGCNVWGIGMEMDTDVRREAVKWQVRELMDGEKGKEMKMKAMEWKRLAEEATTKGVGESYLSLKNRIEKVLLS